MSFCQNDFRLSLEIDWMEPSLPCYRPPSWPPPRDWIVSIDQAGNVISRWGDDTWDFTPWAKKNFKLKFRQHTKKNHPQILDEKNSDIMRLIATWLLWGVKSIRTPNTLEWHFNIFRRIVSICSAHGVLASEIMHYPALLDKIPHVVPSSIYRAFLTNLQRLWDARDKIGFTLIDINGIKRLAESMPPHENIQTAYIPPRIWIYQIQRLQLCLENFIENLSGIEDCFNFCCTAYERNIALSNATTKRSRINPFQNAPKTTRKVGGTHEKLEYHGRFSITAERFGILDVLNRWVAVPSDGLSTKQLSGYLSLVQYAGLAYIVNFTLQRIEEAASLRSDCLEWDVDENLGRIPIIRGETTKTQSDSDARWPTSPRVQLAITAMCAIARLRNSTHPSNEQAKHPKSNDQSSYIFGRSFGPWVGRQASHNYSARPHTSKYNDVFTRFPKLFDPNQFRINESDLTTARMFTPNIEKNNSFRIGEIWPLGWHQLRRTGAVNMFASGLVSNSSMQMLMKHTSPLMPLYYGRGHTSLHINKEVEATVFEAMNEVFAQKLLSTKSDLFISPLGADRKNEIVIKLIGTKDAKSLAAAGRSGHTSFREIRLGACTKTGWCEYGGIESVARCAGSGDTSPCVDVLFDRSKSTAIADQIIGIENTLERIQPGSPHYKALVTERLAMENFLNAISRQI